MTITKRQVLKYTLLPGFIPRIFAFFTSGFSHLSYYIALVYSIAGLLPPNHPYLNGNNIGQYGIRHVISAAANNLVFTRKNIDQIFIFFIILAGLVLMLIQFLLLLSTFIFYQPAFALTLEALFQNPNAITGSKGPDQDVAFMILDRVFGVRSSDTAGFFGSCISIAGTACTDTRGADIPGTSSMTYPFPFHLALHSMLQFYSFGILVIGALVIIYFVISIVGETASTGTPFGQRFNKAWAPVRIILFFGLIIPFNTNSVNAGLNMAQIITLWTARQGSNFATNAWSYFNIRLTAGTIMGDQESLIARPNIPELGSIHQFMLTARTCGFAEMAGYGNEIKAYIVRPKPQAFISSGGGGSDAGAGAAGGSGADAIEFVTTDYSGARDFVQDGNITVRFGAIGEAVPGSGVVEQYNEYTGNVFPYCGEIVLETTDLQEPGSVIIAQKYYEMVQNMWMDDANIRASECLYRKHVNDEHHNVDSCPDLPDQAFATGQMEKYRQEVNTAVIEGIEEQRNKDPVEVTVPDQLLEKGWAGAAIWYNRVAQMNGAITGAILNSPRPYKYPYALELAYEARIQENADVGGEGKYSLRLANNRLINLPEDRHVYHIAMYEAYRFWSQDGIQGSAQTKQVENIVIDTINAVLGTSGLFEIRNNTNVHPLAQLTSVGKAMMQAVVRNTGYATAGVVGEGVLGIIGPFPKQLAGLAKNFFFAIVSASIGISVILFYVLPFLPFIYFVFAISGWVKSIFEAIVAMPLWALAHIRIDGEGIPGPAASNGYFLLLEIFLRPVLIVVGLVSTISIFGALVVILNNVFDIVVSNIGGYDIRHNAETGPQPSPLSLEFYRGPIDEFFFTAMYAIICYIVGLATFKLIDLIPNSILRWMGVSVATFQENAGDPASELTQQIYRGSILISNQVRGSTRGDLAAIVSG